MIKSVLSTAGALALLCGMGSGTAQAATASQGYIVNATGACQAALPVFEGNIRKRPTAVANEGTSNAFVSCSLPTGGELSSGIEMIFLAIYNRNAAPASVSCSLVNGFQAGALIVPKTITVPANGRESLIWRRADVGNPLSMRWANFSCNLLPGTDVGYVSYTYSYEIGS